MDSAQYAETVARIRADLRSAGRVAVKVNDRAYDVIAVSTTSAPVRTLYVAADGRREFIRGTVAELISELASVISSGSWSEFEFRDYTDPGEALEDITGSFFQPPDDLSSGRRRAVSSASFRPRLGSSSASSSSSGSPPPNA